MNILWNNFLGLGEAVASLLLLIDSVIYWLISELYGLYVVLAQAKIFKDELYVDIANKVYLVMGVVALFIVVYVLLQSIVNPDNFKKSGMDFVKKFVIAIIMIILTPAIFNFLYTVQDTVLSDNIIENIFLGNNNSTTDATYATYFYDRDNPSLTSEEIMAKIEDDTNTEYSADKFVVDEDGNETGRFLIRYIVSSDCTYKDYKKAMKNCEKVDVNKLDESNNKLIKRYGNDMTFTVLEAFLHPDYDSGMTDDITIVNASNAAGVKGKGVSGWIGCGLGAAGAIVIGAIGTAAGVITWGAGSGVTVASIGTAAGIVGAACGGGALAAGEIYEAVNYEEYSWTMAKNEILADGKFSVITAFAGDGSKGNQGIIGGEMSYTPIVSTICGAVLLYMIFGFCLDLGLRAAKLAFYQMLAPVTFLLNILPGQKDLLTNWIKLVLTTWGEVFVRIFTMIAVVYLFSSLDMLTLENTYGIVAKAIIVMGLVMFVKQFPKLLGDVTGIKSENMKLGIMDKLNAGTLGFAGGVAGAATGFLGAGIAAKAAGAGFLSGGLSGMANGWKARGNQFGKQKQSMYKSLGGKGKAGIFGRQSMLSKLEKNMKDAPKNTVNKNVTKFESGQDYQNTLANLYASHYGMSVDDYNEANSLGLDRINSELQNYDVNAAEMEINSQDKFLEAIRNNTDYASYANKMFTNSEYFDKTKSMAENKAALEKFKQEKQREIDESYVSNGGQHAVGVANALAKKAEQQKTLDRVATLERERTYLNTSHSMSDKERAKLDDTMNSRAREIYENMNTNDTNIKKYKADLKLQDQIGEQKAKADAKDDFAKYLKDFMKDNDIKKDDKK